VSDQDELSDSNEQPASHRPSKKRVAKESWDDIIVKGQAFLKDFVKLVQQHPSLTNQGRQMVKSISERVYHDTGLMLGTTSRFAMNVLYASLSIFLLFYFIPLPWVLVALAMPLSSMIAPDRRKRRFRIVIMTILFFALPKWLFFMLVVVIIHCKRHHCKHKRPRCPSKPHPPSPGDPDKPDPGRDADTEEFIFLGF